MIERFLKVNDMNDLTFKERMIFELEKDDYIKGCKNTSNIWIERYHITTSEARKIYNLVVNYQIETYGHEKNHYYEGTRDYHRNWNEKTPRKRRNKYLTNYERRDLQKFERRNEKWDSDF